MILAHLPSGYLLGRASGGRRAVMVAAPVAAFFGAVMMHLCLDTVNGGILWLWPFSDRLYSLVTVPATRSHWVLSFLTHWSTLAELAIISAAALALRRDLTAHPSRHKIE